MIHKGTKYIAPIPPTLFAEITLLFDHDFPVEHINGLLGLDPTESLRQSQTRTNPITGKNNPGFWLFKTKEISSFDVEPLLLMIERFLVTHSSGLHQVIQQYSPCCFILSIRVLIHQEEEYPAIRFNPGLLQLLSSMNVTIDIEVENDYL